MAETGRLSQQIGARLRAMIAAGEIHPGERLVELKLAASLGVSRSPVRQALNQLATEGLVELNSRRGFIVAGQRGAEVGVAAEVVALSDFELAQKRQWERIYHEVEQTVLIEMLHGSIKLNELRLAEHFGVSRSVTRDVLARMNGVGLISKNRSGQWIAEKITPKKVRDLYELRRLLEPAALMHAAAVLAPDQVRSSRKRVESLLQATSVESGSFDRVEHDLHIDIIGRCPNRDIVDALSRTHVLFAPTRYLLDPVLSIPLDSIEDALKEHLRILRLLEERDPAGAAAELSEHIQGAVERWLMRFDAGLSAKRSALPDYLSVIDSP